MCVMKMGNIVPRARIEPTSLAFQVSVQLLHHVGSLMSPLYLRLPVYADQRSAQSTTLISLFNADNYIHTGNGLTYTHTQDRFNNHTACSLYRIMVTATSVMCVIKMGNIVPRARLEPTSLASRASVLPLHHIGSPMSLLYPRVPVYAAPCPRSQ